MINDQRYVVNRGVVIQLHDNFPNNNCDRSSTTTTQDAVVMKLVYLICNSSGLSATPRASINGSGRDWIAMTSGCHIRPNILR